MKEDLINYWLLRAVSASRPDKVYELFAIAVDSFYDDPITVQWWYEQLEAADRWKKGGEK